MRKRCPYCKRIRPSYLYESHIKQCKAERYNNHADGMLAAFAALRALQARGVPMLPTEVETWDN